jgi:hypothetical protein
MSPPPMSPPENVILAPANYNATQERVLEMLGNGLAPSVCASALGLSESTISQYMSEEAFARAVTERRFINLQAATSRDKSYDDIEDALIDKMRDLLPMMYKPMEVLRAITVINAAKRRGAAAPDNTVIHQTVVQLTLPAIVQSRFIKNINNQVIEAGEQQLVTIPAKHLTDKLKQYNTSETNYEHIAGAVTVTVAR